MFVTTFFKILIKLAEMKIRHMGLFSDSVLYKRVEHIFERKDWKSSRNFSSIANKWSLVIGCN